MKLEEIAVNPEQNTRPEAIILVGVPGSGKSTWSRNFINNTDKQYVVVSSDAVLDKIATEKGLTYSEVFKDYIGMATGQSKRDFADAIAGNKNVIIDQTNVSKKKRKSLLAQIPKHYKKVAVVFNTDDKEVERRLKTREMETGKHIPDHVMKDMYGRWETPTKDEGFDVIINA